MALEIEGLLERLGEINDQLSQCIAGTTTTTSGAQKLARHRDILYEFTQVGAYRDSGRSGCRDVGMSG